MSLDNYEHELLSVMADTHCAEGGQVAAFEGLARDLRAALKPFVKEMRKG